MMMLARLWPVTPADSSGARAAEFQLKRCKTVKPGLEKITVNSSRMRWEHIGEWDLSQRAKSA
jgi:hypothetical protein